MRLRNVERGGGGGGGGGGEAKDIHNQFSPFMELLGDNCTHTCIYILYI